MGPAFWSTALVATSGGAGVSWAVGKALLDFLDSFSRGSSWHRCPMLRLMHLVHGLACHDSNPGSTSARCRTNGSST